RFVGLPGGDGTDEGEALRLAQEKQRLVAEIQRPGAPRRELTRRIEAVNERLYALLEPVRKTLEARLRQAVLAEAERQASLHREYPAFLYEPVRLRRMTETVLAGLRRVDDAARGRRHGRRPGPASSPASPSGSRDVDRSGSSARSAGSSSQPTSSWRSRNSSRWCSSS
ncbi:MAG: hypothetical protein GX496_08945, partial [Firmicutes bacterium]|nr:hypothetical protein [Bacillota bacterium]